MHVEDAVELGLDRERVQPLDELLPIAASEELVGLHHLGPIERWLTEPALAVAADPRRVRQFAQTLDRLLRPWARRAVVPSEEPAVDVQPIGLGENPLERGQVAVNVVEDSSTVASVAAMQTTCLEQQVAG